MAMLPMSMAQHRRISRTENGVEIPGTWLDAFIHNGNYYLAEIRIYVFIKTAK